MGDGFDDVQFDVEQGVSGLLPSDESLDGDEVGDDLADLGFSPPDKPLARGWGFLPSEAGRAEPFDSKLAREVPDLTDEYDGDGIGDASDTDGELIDDQVGTVRAGRLVWAPQDPGDFSSDLRARDVGVDGAAASAEEAAIHVVDDDGTGW